MTGKTRTTTTLLATRKVGGRKALERVTYRRLWPLWPSNGQRRMINGTRFTVKKNLAWDLFGIWDKKTDRWLYPCEPKTLYTSHAAAREYLRTTKEDDPEYKLARVNQALGGEAAA